MHKKAPELCTNLAINASATLLANKSRDLGSELGDNDLMPASEDLPGDSGTS